MDKYHIYIELNTRRLILKTDTEILGTYPVAIGKAQTPTPTGEFKVLNKVYQPGGVLGSRWLQFTPQNHGIHGTNKPWLIGQAVSNGCVRMHNSDVEVVYAKVQVGTPVSIAHSFTKGDGSNPPRNGGSYFLYTVQPGDSLWKIGQRYNISVARLKAINNLQSDMIYPGQKLKIPN